MFYQNLCMCCQKIEFRREEKDNGIVESFQSDFKAVPEGRTSFDVNLSLGRKKSVY